MTPGTDAPAPAEPAPKNGGGKRLRRKLLEYAVAVVIALVVAEVGARVFLRIPPRGRPEGLQLKMQVPASEAPGMVNALRPRSENSAVYPTLAGGEVEIHYRVNADGFRDRVYSKERREGTYRIAVLGDSVTFGTGVALEDTSTKILEKLFDERYPGLRVEVMNCGVYAFNTAQQAAHLKYRVLAFRPDMVIFCSTITDASGDGVRIAPGERETTWENRWIARLGLTSGRWEPGPEATPAMRRMLKLRNASALADFLSNRAYNYLRGRVMEGGYHADWDAGSPGWTLVRDALTSASRLANEHGFELRVAFYPILTRLESYPFRREHEALGGICADLGIPYHDLLPAFEGRSAAALHAHAHDKHPNAAANRLAAEHLFAILLPTIEAAIE